MAYSLVIPCASAIWLKGLQLHLPMLLVYLFQRTWIRLSRKSSRPRLEYSTTPKRVFQALRNVRSLVWAIYVQWQRSGTRWPTFALPILTTRLYARPGCAKLQIPLLLRWRLLLSRIA